MIKKLRKSQKIILLIALIISFYFMIHPEYRGYYATGRPWLWEETGEPIIYSKMILNVFITCIGTGIALFIESLIYSKKEEGL